MDWLGNLLYHDRLYNRGEKMTVLISSDWHLTDNARDEYRWELFPWLRKQAKKTGAKQLIVCGDLTDAKDRHSGRLVNRFLTEVSQLASLLDVVFLRGNHDGLNEGSAFFAFMELMKNNPHFVHFITKPEPFSIDDGVAGSRTSKDSLLLPCTKNYQSEWAGLNLTDKSLKYIFCHQTFDGALAENGVELRGIPPSVFAGFKGKVFSGDIHHHQKIGLNIEYIGCPYRVRFGDRFYGRVLQLRKGEVSEIRTPFITREVVTIRRADELNDLGFEVDTQVKVKVRLKRSEYPEWPEVRKQISAVCLSKEWALCGTELLPLKTKDLKPREDEPESAQALPEDVVRDYARRKKLDKPMTQLGLELLKEAH